MTKTTIITSCKGRLTHLAQSVATWLRATPAPIIIVSDGCPELSAPWSAVLHAPRIKICMTEADIDSDFSKPRALNYGVTESETDHVLFLDADTLLMTGFWDWYAPRVAEDALFMVAPSPERRDLTGVLGCWTPSFLAVGGYDTGMVGWGSEDLDLRLRLFLTQHPRVIEIPPDLLTSLPHPDTLRTRYYSEKDKMASHHRNLQRLVDSAERITGQSIWSLMADPAVGRMFGHGLGPEWRGE